MKKLKLQIVSLFLLMMLLGSVIAVGGLGKKNIIHQEKTRFVSRVNDDEGSDDFYFVHLTDTHVMHKLFDRKETTTRILKSVIEQVTSFNEKPAFVVITGDLVEWGGKGYAGGLNCQTFVNCLYEQDDQLYADMDCSIPVYTTPGNHDYCFATSLDNYHLYIDKNHVAEEDRYIVTYGDVCLFFLDSGYNYILEPWDWFRVLGSGLFVDDIIWLIDALASCNAARKIILMHHPAVSYRDGFGVMKDVIARNREVFLQLCDTFEVDLVLTGHTHHAIVFDGDENVYEELPLNCSQYPTLYVQSDDCKQECHYRNISIVSNDIWLDECAEIEVTSVNYEYAKEIAKFPVVRSFKEMSIEKQEAVTYHKMK